MAFAQGGITPVLNMGLEEAVFVVSRFLKKKHQNRGQRLFQGSWGYDCLWLYLSVSLFYFVTSLKYMYWTELTLDASDSFNFIYSACIDHGTYIRW